MKLHHFAFLVFANARRAFSRGEYGLDFQTWQRIQLPAHSLSAMLEAWLS
jgi:hypothetical protein